MCHRIVWQYHVESRGVKETQCAGKSYVQLWRCGKSRVTVCCVEVMRCVFDFTWDRFDVQVSRDYSSAPPSRTASPMVTSSSNASSFDRWSSPETKALRVIFVVPSSLLVVHDELQSWSLRLAFRGFHGNAPWQSRLPLLGLMMLCREWLKKRCCTTPAVTSFTVCLCSYIVSELFDGRQDCEPTFSCSFLSSLIVFHWSAGAWSSLRQCGQFAAIVVDFVQPVDRSRLSIHVLQTSSCTCSYFTFDRTMRCYSYFQTTCDLHAVNILRWWCFFNSSVLTRGFWVPFKQFFLR